MPSGPKPHLPEPDQDLEALFLSSLPEIDAAARAVGRRFRLAPNDVEDFCSTIKLSMIENGYRVLARFEGRSSFRTYLRTVVVRQFLDLHRKTQGRWRSSAAAARLGGPAVELERLIHAQGLSIEQAVFQIAQDPKCAHSCEGLTTIARTLPPRVPARAMRRAVGLDEPGAAEIATTSVTPEDQLMAARVDARAQHAIDAAMALVSPQELRMLRMRFERGLSVADIARTLGLNARRLYRGMESALQKLRAGIEHQGVCFEELVPVLSSGRLELRWPPEASMSAGERVRQARTMDLAPPSELAA